MPLSVSNTVIDSTGRELLQYGTAEFPISFYEDDLDIVEVPWHWHPELELVHVIRGREQVHADGKSLELSAGEAVFINSGVLHAANPLDAGTIQHAMVFNSYVLGDPASVYHQRYLASLLQDASCRLLKFSPEVEWQKQVIDRMDDAWQAGAVGAPFYEWKVRNALSELLCILQGSGKNRGGGGKMETLSPAQLRDSERIKKMLLYLEQHLSDTVALEEVAASADLSVSETLRCFHRTLQMTPIQFLRRFRIQKTAEMLADTNLRVSDIAERCGFQDMSYFSKTFREMKGCSPTQYRKQRKDHLNVTMVTPASPSPNSPRR